MPLSKRKAEKVKHILLYFDEMLNSQSFIINCTKLFYDMKGYLCYKFFETIPTTINWYGIIASFLNVCFCFSFNLDFILNKFFLIMKN